MSECEQVDRQVTLTVTFRGCADHGLFEPMSSNARFEGIDVFSATDALLGTIEEAIAIELSTIPHVKEWVEIEHEWAWSDEGAQEQLPDRAKEWVVRHLAHQLILQRVAQRGYQIGRTSASMRLPM